MKLNLLKQAKVGQSRANSRVKLRQYHGAADIVIKSIRGFRHGPSAVGKGHYVRPTVADAFVGQLCCPSICKGPHEYYANELAHTPILFPPLNDMKLPPADLIHTAFRLHWNHPPELKHPMNRLATVQMRLFMRGIYSVYYIV